MFGGYLSLLTAYVCFLTVICSVSARYLLDGLDLAGGGSRIGAATGGRDVGSSPGQYSGMRGAGLPSALNLR